MTNKSELTRNQKLVLNVLAHADNSVSAYTILDLLRDDGFRAPLQVYRALEKLIELGLAHRLESLNSFVACRHPQCEAHEAVAFTICDKCETVAELADDQMVRKLKALALKQDFEVETSSLELRGVCGACRSS